MHGVNQQVSSTIGNLSVCVYIHTYTHAYIYIYIHTNKPWFNSTHSESVSEYLNLCRFFQDISMLGNLSFQGHMQTVFLFETKCSLHKPFTRRLSMIFFPSTASLDTWSAQNYFNKKTHYFEQISVLHSGKHLLSTVDFVVLCITGDCLLTLLVQKKIMYGDVFSAAWH